MSRGERPEAKKSLVRRTSTPERAFKGKSHLLKRDREGVASTVGTIMALLVFITFLALLTNSYVPAWMQDNERSHMSEVFNQFGELKGKIDSLIVSAQITGDGSINLYQPISLGSEGVPVFASPTAGLLTYIPKGAQTDSNVNVVFHNGSSSYNQSGGGRIELYAANRYYVQQWVAYENGAILVKQEDGQVVRAFPSFDVKKVNEAVNIKFTQIDLLGSNITQAGTGSSGLNIDLLYTESHDYGITGAWIMNITTQYGSAWEKYLNDTCSQAGLILGTDYRITSQSTAITDQTVVTLTILTANMLTYSNAYLSMTLA